MRFALPFQRERIANNFSESSIENAGKTAALFSVFQIIPQRVEIDR
jgi:hypothetical protein